MFVFNHETGTYWFNSNSLENDNEFMLIGIIMALAIFNGLILDVHFPNVVYKKLLNKPVGFGDLKLSHPV